MIRGGPKTAISHIPILGIRGTPSVRKSATPRVSQCVPSADTIRLA
jgi:hypothetical protein